MLYAMRQAVFARLIHACSVLRYTAATTTVVIWILLVDALPGATLFDLGGLQVELEELLGVPVDLLTLGDLPQKFRNQVLAESRPV